MSDIRNTLKEIDGATEIFFCGMDGIVIDFIGENQDILAADIVSSLKYIKLHFPNIIIYYLKEKICVIRVFDEGFCCVVMSLSGNVARAKLK